MNEHTKADVLDEMILETESRLAEWRQKTALEEKYLSDLQQKRSGLPLGQKKATKTVENVENGSAPQRIIAVLRSAGHKLDLEEITKKVEAQGLTSRAKKGSIAIITSALARRKDLFVRVGKGVYDLVERHSERTNTKG
jgi:predicted TIM-barrel enzyme